jgi:hypothetical protein
MPFAAFHLFAAIVAALSAQFCGLDPLAVETARSGVLGAALFLAYPGAPGVMQLLPIPHYPAIGGSTNRHGAMWDTQEGASAI